MPNSTNENNDTVPNNRIVPKNCTVTFVKNVRVTYKDAQIKPSGCIIMQPNTEISFHNTNSHLAI